MFPGGISHLDRGQSGFIFACCVFTHSAIQSPFVISPINFLPVLLLLSFSSRRGGGISEHDQKRPRGSGRWGHYGMHHGVGAGRVRVQTPDPQAIPPAHVTTGSTG